MTTTLHLYRLLLVLVVTLLTMTIDTGLFTDALTWLVDYGGAEVTECR